MPEPKPRKQRAKPLRSPDVVTAAEPLPEPDTADLTNQFRTAHYSAAVTAWFGTKMEKDKGLLTLAAAGIALLATIGATSTVEKTFSGIASSFFVLTVFCTLVVFELNAKLIENLILEQTMDRLGRIAKLVDHAMLLFFLLGVVAVAMLGVARFMHW